MRTTTKAIGVIVFVGALSALLIRPVLNAYDQRADGAGPQVALPTDEPDQEPEPETPEATSEPSPEAEPTVEPDPSPEPEPGVVGPPARLFVDLYPRACLKRARSAGRSLVAALGRGGRVRIGGTSGNQVGSFADAGPVQWSPSGRFIASGSGRIWRSDGRRVGNICSADGCSVGSAQWGWSTISDCLVWTSSDGTLEVGGPDLRPRVLLERGVTSFSYSPNGRYLALVMVPEEESPVTIVAVADLKLGKVTSLVGGAGRRETMLAGWSPNGRHVLFWRDLASSRKLEAVRLSGRGSTLTYARPTVHDFDPLGALTTCGDGLLGVLSTDDLRSQRTRLAFLDGGGPRFVTGANSYSGITCSPSGSFIVVAQGDRGDRRLVALSSAGEEVQQLTNDPRFNDGYPSWGEGTGVLFVRVPPRGPAEIWFAPEGGSPRSAGLTVEHEEGCNLYGAFDWTGDDPTGFPASYNMLCVTRST